MAQQFTTYNTDVAPLTPTVNPRSQLDTPELFQSGQQYWESFEVYVPQTLTLPTKGWISLESAVYGAPFGGTPPATISINDGAFRFQRNGVGTNPFQVAWTAPVVKGQWYRFTWHFDMAANGWIELYVNDVQQQLKSGSSSVLQLPIAMIDKSDEQARGTRRSSCTTSSASSRAHRSTSRTTRSVPPRQVRSPDNRTAGRLRPRMES